MLSDDLLKPVSEQDPCGPDLERNDDPEFLDYYFDAESRLPERYFTPGQSADGHEDRLFDPRSVDLPVERTAILTLLKRSRDLRLLSLLARFQALAGRLGDFVDTIEMMAAMMRQWPDELHPRVDRGTGDRRAAIEALNTQAVVIMALQHLPLLPNTEATLRRQMVAAGKLPPRAQEQDVPGSDVLAPLRADAARKAVTDANDQLSRAADALHQISRFAASQPDAAFTPELDGVRDVIAEMQAMIISARHDLRPWTPTADDMTMQDPGLATAALLDEVPAETTDPATTRPASAPAIGNRATAAAALDQAKAWLARFEPSSPALVLVTQARLLVGAPLVEAIEVLMPGQAGAAILNIGQGSGFSLPMDRMKTLTKAGLDEPATDSDPVTPLPGITRRTDLVGHLLGVEGYFAAHEPASPIPLLLVKARDMLGKRFDAIMAELVVVPRQNA